MHPWLSDNQPQRIYHPFHNCCFDSLIFPWFNTVRNLDCPMMTPLSPPAFWFADITDPVFSFAFSPIELTVCVLDEPLHCIRLRRINRKPDADTQAHVLLNAIGHQRVIINEGADSVRNGDGSLLVGIRQNNGKFLPPRNVPPYQSLLYFHESVCLEF